MAKDMDNPDTKRELEFEDGEATHEEDDEDDEDTED
jgi:hypothetical protein